VGGFDICPSNATDETTPDPDTVTDNPLGRCRCDGELWISEGCTYGFYCDSAMENGGEYLGCPAVRLISLPSNLYVSK
jgi:hypothetical protein